MGGPQPKYADIGPAPNMQGMDVEQLSALIRSLSASAPPQTVSNYGEWRRRLRMAEREREFAMRKSELDFRRSGFKNQLELERASMGIKSDAEKDIIKERQGLIREREKLSREAAARENRLQRASKIGMASAERRERRGQERRAAMRGVRSQYRERDLRVEGYREQDKLARERAKDENVEKRLARIDERLHELNMVKARRDAQIDVSRAVAEAERGAGLSLADEQRIQADVAKTLMTAAFRSKEALGIDVGDEERSLIAKEAMETARSFVSGVAKRAEISGEPGVDRGGMPMRGGSSASAMPFSSAAAPTEAEVYDRINRLYTRSEGKISPEELAETVLMEGSQNLTGSQLSAFRETAREAGRKFSPAMYAVKSGFLGGNVIRNPEAFRGTGAEMDLRLARGPLGHLVPAGLVSYYSLWKEEEDDIRVMPDEGPLGFPSFFGKRQLEWSRRLPGDYHQLIRSINSIINPRDASEFTLAVEEILTSKDEEPGFLRSILNPSGQSSRSLLLDDFKKALRKYGSEVDWMKGHGAPDPVPEKIRTEETIRVLRSRLTGQKTGMSMERLPETSKLKSLEQFMGTGAPV